MLIRPASPGDAAALLEIYAPYVENTVISFEYTVPSAAAYAARIEAVLALYPWLVAEAGGETAGFAYAARHSEREAYQWSVDVSVYLHPAHHGKGIGKALYQRLFAILRELGHVNAYAGIALPNPASVGLHEALGFTPVGVYKDVGYKFGRWHDVGWWQMELQPHSPDPRPPRPFGKD